MIATVLPAGSSLRRPVVRLLAAVALASGLALLVASPSQAAIPSAFDGAVQCTAQPDGTRLCGSSDPRSTVETFDGVPIDVNVAFPKAPAAGNDGRYPLIMVFHGYGGGKIGFGAMQSWLDRGYAVFSMTDRGFRESCGSKASRDADPAGCANGYVRLIDTRYEVRDAQLFAGMLADEGLIDPRRIGATGGSYGGGLSLALAALRNRTALEDGTLVPWESPGGIAMELAAATPSITWSDLAYSLVPNGGTLDYVVDNGYGGRYGVMKESLVNGLYLSGQLAPGFYAPKGSDPSADLTGWRERLRQGEPYDGDPDAAAILSEIVTNHSAYYIDSSIEPAPLLLANGFTDDLFPVDEMVRFYNSTLDQYPDAKVNLFAAEIVGHPRGSVREDALQALRDRQQRWFDYYVAGRGTEPAGGAEAFTQTCPDEAASGGPYRARDWARLAPGEVRVKGGGAQTIDPDGGSAEVAAAFNPVTGDGSCAQTDAADQPGTATYRTDPAPRGGFTLLGSPLVTATYEFGGNTSQVAARLLDVGPDGKQTLVARAVWRPRSDPDERQPFQLHPNGWRFARGHVAKLELLGSDADGGALGSYARASDGQQPVEVSNLNLRLPVVERPGALGGLVDATARKPIPAARGLAVGYKQLIKARAKLAKGGLQRRGGKLRAKLSCPALFDSCNDGRVIVKRDAKRGGFRVASGRFELEGGETSPASLALSKRGRRWFRNHRGLAVVVKTTSAERPGKAKQKRRARG